MKPLVCFKCGKPGHIAVRCLSGGSGASQAGGDGSTGAAHAERRVDICVVQSPSGTGLIKVSCKVFLLISVPSTYSLVNENMAAKFSGKRFNEVVSMIGIGQIRVLSETVTF